MTDLYNNGTFRIAPTVFRDPFLEQEVTGYGIFNIATNIREGEGRRLHYVIGLADRYKDALEHVHDDPQEELIPGGVVLQ